MEKRPQLRAELEPQVAVAVQRYPQALALLAAYDEACDKGDALGAQVVIEKLRQLTGKEVTEADLFEYYEASSKGELAICLVLPAPRLVEDITKVELLEIVRRLCEPMEPTQAWEAMTLMEQISLYYLRDYYYSLLKLNFPTRYRYQYFGRQKGPDGQYYELSAEYIATKLLA